MENVSFNEIPASIRTPGVYIEIDNSRAVQGLAVQERRILVMGQRLAAGTVAANIPTRVLNSDQAEQFFGRGSALQAMLSASLQANRTTETWAVALDDDAGGVAALGDIKFGGVVNQAGSLHLYIAGEHLQMAVAVGEASNVTAANVVIAINAMTDLPVTALIDGVDDTKVNLTARNKGMGGNGIDLRTNYFQGEVLPGGLTVVITPMAAGAGNPDITTALTALGDEQYYTIINPWTDAANMAALEAELTTRFGPMEQRTGHSFSVVADTLANLSTYGNARNSPHSTVMGVNDSPTPAWIWAAVLGAVVEFHGAIDPARPFQTLVLPFVLPPPEQSRFTREERDVLLHDGVSTFTVGNDGTVRIERTLTTYQTNAFGVADSSYLDLNTVWTVDYIRFAVRARITSRFPRYKLASDGTRISPGQAVVTPRVIRGELVALFRELEDAGQVENLDQFIADLVVVRSVADPNRVNAVIPPDIINQFRVFAAAVQFRL